MYHDLEHEFGGKPLTGQNLSGSEAKVALRMSDSSNIEFDERKFKELILYIAERSEDDPWFGATKLNKILFYSDFIAYGVLGEPITGAEYQKLAHGPAPTRLLPIRKEMMDAGELAIRRERVMKFTQKRPTALREADVSVFSAAEIEVVDDLIRLFRERSAGEVSKISHGEVCWQLAGVKEKIPYEAIFLSRRQPEERHITRAREIAGVAA